MRRNCAASFAYCITVVIAANQYGSTFAQGRLTAIDPAICTKHCLATLLPMIQATTLLSADSMEETPEMVGCLVGNKPPKVCSVRSGMPPHKLTLKDGAPVMLLRNMHGAHGQANGTRMLICNTHLRVIEAEIVTGCSIGKVVCIPRINTNPANSALPLTFRRRHFPLRPAFAMTINKAQSQTLRMAGCPLSVSPMVSCMWL